MPPLTTGSAANHLAPGIRGIVGTRLEGRETFYSQLYNVETSQRNYEDYLAATGLPIAVEKPQGVNIQSFDPIEGSTKRMTHVVYAIGFEVTEEAWDDDLYKGSGSMLREASEGLADSIAERTELEASRPFNTEGFDGTFTVLPDTLSIFNTAHTPIPGAQGITQANRPASNADLNVTSYRAALTASRRLRDDQGKRIPAAFRNVKLWVPPENEYTALEIVKSSNRPDTANKVENVSMNATSVGVCPYMDDTDSWFLQGNKTHNVFLWRWRPRMDSFDDRRARVAVHVAYVRFSYAFVHWLGWYGSPGE